MSAETNNGYTNSTLSEEVQPTIQVGRKEFRTALKHGIELYHSDSTPKKRLDQRGGNSGFSRYANARVEGKLAEVAFSRFLERFYGIESEVDWRIYGDYNQTDHGDVRCLFTDEGQEVPPAVEFDVKKTKSYNSWLAIRESMWQKHPEDAPIVLCTMNLQDDVDIRQWQSWDEYPADDYEFEQRLQDFEDDNFPLPVTVEGAVYKDEFTHRFEQGDRLHDPDDPSYKFSDEMRMDNKAIPVQDLDATKERWDRVVGEIVGDHEITWEPLSG